MNWDQIEGKWKQAAGSVKEKWGKLTDNDLTVINGKKDQLVGKIQERYGIAKEEAQKQVEEFSHNYRVETTTTTTKNADGETTRTVETHREKAHGAGKS
jgi:uncharacterized protein YjbJ (UPF0337 family)